MDYIKIEVLRVAAICTISLLFAGIETKEAVAFLSNPQQVVVQGRTPVSSPENGHRPSRFFSEQEEDIDLNDQVTQMRVSDDVQKLSDQVCLVLNTLQVRLDTQNSITHEYLRDIKEALSQLNKLVTHNGVLYERGRGDVAVHYKNSQAIAQRQVDLLAALQKKLEEMSQAPHHKESLENQKNLVNQMREIKDIMILYKDALADIVSVIKQQQQDKQAVVTTTAHEQAQELSFFERFDGYKPYAASVGIASIVGLKISVSSYLYTILNDVYSWSLFSTLSQKEIQSIDQKKLAQALYDAACKKYAGVLQDFSKGAVQARFLIDIAKEMQYLHTWQIWYNRLGRLARWCMPVCFDCNERIERLRYYQDVCIEKWKDS